MKKTNWTAIALFAIAALLVVQLVASLLGGWGYGSRGYGGWGMMGPGMMGWGFSPFGWIGMAFMWLIPIGVIALIVYGVVALARNTGNPPPSAPLAPCPNCGRGAQADWQNCPYCGTKLK